VCRSHHGVRKFRHDRFAPATGLRWNISFISVSKVHGYSVLQFILITQFLCSLSWYYFHIIWQLYVSLLAYSYLLFRIFLLTSLCLWPAIHWSRNKKTTWTEITFLLYAHKLIGRCVFQAANVDSEVIMPTQSKHLSVHLCTLRTQEHRKGILWKLIFGSFSSTSGHVSNFG
jgi:hypothetical protein